MDPLVNAGRRPRGRASGCFTSRATKSPPVKAAGLFLGLIYIAGLLCILDARSRPAVDPRRASNTIIRWATLTFSLSWDAIDFLCISEER